MPKADLPLMPHFSPGDPRVDGYLRIPLMWNAESGDLERGFRRSGTLVGAQRRLVSQ